MDAPIYERFDTNEGFQGAVDRLMEQPGRELRVFDPDGAALRLNEPQRIERLARFLIASRSMREVQDAFLLLDAMHYVRRPMATLFRGAMGLGDENEGQALRGRFGEIWAASYPAVSSTTVGL